MEGGLGVSDGGDRTRGVFIDPFVGSDSDGGEGTAAYLPPGLAEAERKKGV